MRWYHRIIPLDIELYRYIKVLQEYLTLFQEVDWVEIGLIFSQVVWKMQSSAICFDIQFSCIKYLKLTLLMCWSNKYGKSFYFFIKWSTMNSEKRKGIEGYYDEFSFLIWWKKGWLIFWIIKTWECEIQVRKVYQQWPMATGHWVQLQK
jgi:hypothetical protein